MSVVISVPVASLKLLIIYVLFQNDILADLLAYKFQYLLILMSTVFIFTFYVQYQLYTFIIRKTAAIAE